MFVDIALAVIFITSAVMVWYRISLKVPELITIPDAVITEKLEQGSAGIRLFLLRFKALYHEKRILETFYRVLAKTLYRFHIVVLRFDNGLVSFLKKMSAKGAFTITNGNGEYWKQLKTTTESRSHKLEDIKGVGENLPE